MSISDVGEMSREGSPGNWLLLLTIHMGVPTRIFYIEYCACSYLKIRAIFMAKRAVSQNYELSQNQIVLVTSDI